MPEIKYSFVTLDELINKPKDSICGRCPFALPFHDSETPPSVRRDCCYQRSWRSCLNFNQNQQDGQQGPTLHFALADKGVQTSKRELTLVDRSNSSIRLTLWGKQAETYEDGGSNPVIAFKGVRVTEFQGKVQLGSESSIDLNPCLLCRTISIHG